MNSDHAPDTGYNSGMDAPQKPTNARLRRWLFVVAFAVGVFLVHAGYALWPVVRQHFREKQKMAECHAKVVELRDALLKKHPEVLTEGAGKEATILTPQEETEDDEPDRPVP